MLSKSVADKFEEYNDQIADLDDKVAKINENKLSKYLKMLQMHIPYVSLGLFEALEDKSHDQIVDFIWANCPIIQKAKNILSLQTYTYEESMEYIERLQQESNCS